MNFNEEIAKEFKEANIGGGRLVKIAEKDKGTPEDWAKLESKIAIRIAENEKVLRASEVYAQFSNVC